MIISTDHESNNYNIYVGENVLDIHLKEYVDRYPSVFYLVDSHVYGLHKDSKLKTIDNPVLLPRGETSKTLDVYAEVIEELLSRGIKRNSLIVAIGGGATGDVAGFIAATVLRGVDYIQVPTTVLSHDSAVGGKTAINARSGKNLIGRFYRPKCVIMDTTFFQTLERDELLSGYGEVFKHALLNSEAAVEQLMKKHSKSILVSELNEGIIMGINTKLNHVNQDEHESDIRRFLNLGHTLGHALELNNRLLHGHAVIFGMLFTMFVSNQESDSNTFDCLKYTHYFKTLGLPFHKIRETPFHELKKFLSQDKKNTSDAFVSFVLMRDFGQCYVKELSFNEVENYYIDFLEFIIKGA